MSDILNQLPRAYRDGSTQQQIADALTNGVGQVFSDLTTKLNNYYSYYLDPSTCDPLWLDTLADYSGWGKYWDSSYSVAIKRQLLINTEYIWANRGNRDILPFLFKIFGLTASLTANTGFILKQSTLPGYLNYDPFTYNITIPPAYSAASPQYKLITKLIKQFSPCWVTFNYIYSS